MPSNENSSEKNIKFLNRSKIKIKEENHSKNISPDRSLNKSTQNKNNNSSFDIRENSRNKILSKIFI